MPLTKLLQSCKFVTYLKIRKLKFLKNSSLLKCYIQTNYAAQIGLAT